MLVAFAAPVHAATDREQPVYQLNQQQLTDLDALAVGTSESDVREFDADLARAAEASEASIRDYGLVLESAGWTVEGKGDLSQASSDAVMAAQAHRACAGASGYTGYFFPLGHQMALNSCQTSQVIALLGVVIAGGGIGALAAFLGGIGVPIAAVSGIIAAMAGMGLAFLSVYQAYSSKVTSRGVV